MTNQLAQAIVKIGDDDGLRDVLTQVQQLTGMRFSAIAYVSDDRWVASLVDDNLEFGLAAGDELDVRKTICTEVRRDSCEVLIDDTEADALWSTHEVPQLYGFRSYLSVPILIGGSFFGTLCALDREPRSRSLAEVRDQILTLAAEASQRVMQRMHADLGGRSPGFAASQ